MNTDIRIAVSFKGNRKRKKFRMLLGDQLATDYLLDFWISVATDKPSGDLSGLDNLDICLMAGWEGDCDLFVNSLYDAGFLDKTETGYKVHQWEEHNGYASAAAARSDKSRKAAVARWKARGVDTQAMPQPCSSIAQALPEVETSNAPIPIPIPIPINETKDIKVASDEPKQPTKPKKKSLSSLSEEEFFKTLEENPLYSGIEIRKLNEKLKVWCAGKGVKPTRQRLINWLNREDKQLSSGNKRLSSDWEA